MISASILDCNGKSFRGSWKTFLHLPGRGRNTGEHGNEPLVYADAPQEDAFVQELIVIVQQDRRAVYRGKSNSRNTNLKARIKPITWLRTLGGQQTEWFLLTALIKRLSVAAGKISFSRVIFLQLENNRRLWNYDATYNFWKVLSQNCTCIEEPDLVQQRSRMLLKGPSKRKSFWIPHLPQKWLTMKDHFLHANAWWLLCDSDVTLPRESIQLKP